ncbi:hypothetical protein DY000_02022055 [Brassica cretica]|uniref:Uncharacterized protein n=1 Tax=Brassica cretica TaxID=69181 RepID=A0ABQ7EB99_BRACR|nr:hypothetical protein DY000_02022055 [Brassica cretica]
MTLCSAAGKLLDTMSFTYFFIEGDTFMASLSVISNMILSNAFLQIALSNSRLVCDLLGGKGGKVLYTLSTAGLAGVECRLTFFPICRSIFTVVGQSILFLSCRLISTSSSDSSSSSSRYREVLVVIYFRRFSQPQRVFLQRSVAILRFPVKAWFNLNFALPRRDPTVAS